MKATMGNRYAAHTIEVNKDFYSALWRHLHNNPANTILLKGRFEQRDDSPSGKKIVIDATSLEDSRNVLDTYFQEYADIQVSRLLRSIVIDRDHPEMRIEQENEVILYVGIKPIHPPEILGVPMDVRKGIIDDVTRRYTEKIDIIIFLLLLI